MSKPPSHQRASLSRSATLMFLLTLLIPALAAPTAHAAALYSAVPVSDTGTANTLAEPNSSRKIAVSTSGNIYVAYQGGDGIRVARSTNRGQAFEPSVQITATNASVSIAVDANGVVYAAYIHNSGVQLSRSTDNGLTFSAPVNVGSSTSASVDLATDAPYVYILPQDGQGFLVNSASGVGAFSTSTTGLPALAFSGILVDDIAHVLFLIGDTPTLYYVKSTDRGATFGSVVNPNGGIYFSTYVGGFGFIGQKAYIAGGGISGGSTTAAIIDLATGGSTPRTFGNNAVMQSRTLVVDGEGNVVDGYSSGADILFAVSTDQGATFGTPVTVATGATRMEVAYSPNTTDVIAAYEKGGAIYLNIYDGLLPVAPFPPTISSTSDQITTVSAAVGPLSLTVGDSDGDPATTTLTATSSDQAIVQDASITFGGSGTGRTISITASAVGSTIVTIIATDSTGRKASDTFIVTVNPGPGQTITFTAPANTVYGATPIALSASASSGLAVSFSSSAPSMCTVSGTTVTLVAAGTCTIAADQAGNGSYNPAPQVQDSFTIAPAALTITAENKTRMAGTTSPPLTFTADGFVNGDTAATAISGALATSAVIGSPVGDYPITIGTLVAANYTASFTPGTLSVTINIPSVYHVFFPVMVANERSDSLNNGLLSTYSRRPTQRWRLS